MKNPRTLSRIIIAALLALCCNLVFATDFTGGGGDFGGGGAGGSWGDGQCYVTNTLKETLASSAYDSCQKAIPLYPHLSPSLFVFDAATSRCTWNTDVIRFPVTEIACPVTCAADEYFSTKTNQCEKKTCESPYVYDLKQDKCVLPDPPKTCPSGQHLEGDKCVNDPPKTCPSGQHLEGDKCVNDPPKTCDPAIQECDKNGNAKCDCCSKLDAIISNQQTQISLATTANQSLSDILAQQQMTNQKVDEVNQKLATLNQLASALKVDTTAINQNIKTMLNNDKTQADKINKALNDIINLLKNNKTYDDTQLRQMLAKALYELPDKLEKPYLARLPASATASTPIPASATDLTAVIENQDEQTDLLTQIRDLFKDDKENPMPQPEPMTPDEQQSAQIDPWAAIKGFDISQNKINAIKQCPTSKSFVLANNTFNFDFSYLCQFLSALSPIFLALAYFKGAAIIVGSWGD